MALQVVPLGAGVVAQETLHFGPGGIVDFPRLAFLFLNLQHVPSHLRMNSGYVDSVQRVASGGRFQVWAKET